MEKLKIADTVEKEFPGALSFFINRQKTAVREERTVKFTRIAGNLSQSIVLCEIYQL